MTNLLTTREIKNRFEEDMLTIGITLSGGWSDGFRIEGYDETKGVNLTDIFGLGFSAQWRAHRDYCTTEFLTLENDRLRVEAETFECTFTSLKITLKSKDGTEFNTELAAGPWLADALSLLDNLMKAYTAMHEAFLVREDRRIADIQSAAHEMYSK